MRVCGIGPARTRRSASLAVGVATLALLTAACGGGSGSSSEITDAEGDVSADGEKLTVWIMEGTNPDAGPYVDDLSAAFEEETGATLDVPPQTDVLFVRRLRLADDEPMALEDLHVPATVAPGLTGEDLEGTSFYDLLADRYDDPVVSGTQTVEPALVGAEEAALLGVDPGSPVFLFERTSRVRSGGVAEFVRSTYRGDRYRIVVDIFPPDPVQ